MRGTIATGIFIMASVAVTGCAPHKEDWATKWIAKMDAKPPEQRVPNWAHIRSLMLRHAPKVGEAAPDFTLPTVDGEETVKLSALAPNKPKVLIFGSWT